MYSDRYKIKMLSISKDLPPIFSHVGRESEKIKDREEVKKVKKIVEKVKKVPKLVLL